MTDYTALKAELQRYAPLVPLCADALAAIEELERDAKRWRYARQVGVCIPAWEYLERAMYRFGRTLDAAIDKEHRP